MKFLLALILCFSVSLFLYFPVFPQAPWNNPLKIAWSANGTDFSEPLTFQDSSGVPCAIRWKADTLVAVFQWFRKPQGSATWDRVAVKFSYNNGVTWTEPEPIVVDGLPSNYQRPFDPTIVATDSGIRIYYSSSVGLPKPGQDSIINTYSAFGTDGVHYTFEPSARFDAPTRKVIDPALTWHLAPGTSAPGTWHLISPIGAPQEGAYHGVSDDGLTFVELAVIPSDNRHNWTGNFLNDGDSVLRFYGSGERIWFSTSIDATTWSPYISTNIQGGDPTVVKIADDNYLMIYVGQPYPTSVESEEWRAESRVYEEYEEYVEYRVYTVMGQLIEESTTFNESRLATGLYYVVALKNSQQSGTTLLFVP